MKTEHLIGRTIEGVIYEKETDRPAGIILDNGAAITFRGAELRVPEETRAALGDHSSKREKGAVPHAKRADYFRRAGGD
jgi:hypothetical protein